VVRYDDGEIVRVTTLDRGDYVLGVTVETDGRVLLRGNKKTRTFSLSRAPAEPIVQGRSFVIGDVPLRVSRARLDAPSIDKTIAMNPRSGLAELGPSGPIPITLPFDPAEEPIDSIMELPEYRAVFIITRASAYALQDKGSVTEIPGARVAGASRLGALVRLIPVRNETIYLGWNSLNLLLDRRISGDTACSERR
jgi:hypothetical protein